jgi:hypothetical protein
MGPASLTAGKRQTHSNTPTINVEQYHFAPKGVDNMFDNLSQFDATVQYLGYPYRGGLI